MSQENPYSSPQSPQTGPLLGDPIIHTIEGRAIERLKEAKAALGDQYFLFIGICLAGIFLGSLAPLAILMGPMMCGIYLCYRNVFQGKKAEFETLFKGFDYFTDALIATLIMVGISFVLFIPIYVVMFGAMFAGMAANNGEPGPYFMIVMLVMYPLIILVSIAIYVPFVFVFPLITDRKMKGLDAIKLSWKAAKQNLGAVFSVIFINSLLSMLASCACFFPAFLLMPLTFGSIFKMYHEVFEYPDQKGQAIK